MNHTHHFAFGRPEIRKYLSESSQRWSLTQLEKCWILPLDKEHNTSRCFQKVYTAAVRADLWGWKAKQLTEVRL